MEIDSRPNCKKNKSGFFTQIFDILFLQKYLDLLRANPGILQTRQACSPLLQLFYGFASDIDQTNINRDIRDGNWLSMQTLCVLF